MNKYSEYKSCNSKKTKSLITYLKNNIVDNRLIMETIMIHLLCLYVITAMLDSSVLIVYDIYNIIVKVIRYSIYIVCVIYSFIDFFLFHEKKEIPITWFILSALLITVFLVSKNYYPIVFTLILFSYRNISFEKIVNEVKTSTMIVLYMLIILTTLKILPDWTYERDYLMMRHSLGFFYPTMLSTSYLYIMMLDFYVQKRNIKYSVIFTHTLVCSFIYLLSDSRTGYILSLVMVVIMIINKNVAFQTKSRISKVLLSAFPFIMILVTAITCIGYYYRIPIFIQIDRLLSSRLYYSVQGIAEWGLSLFGRHVKLYGWGGYGYMQTPTGFHYNYIDNDYLQILLSYGVLYTITLFAFYSKTIIKTIEKGNNELLIVLIINLILAFIEPNLIKLARDIFILCIASEMFRGGVIYLEIEERRVLLKVKESRREVL